MTERMIKCPYCNKELVFEVTEDEFKPYKRFPIPCIIQHDDHWISLYLDSDFTICDIEIPIVKISKK